MTWRDRAACSGHDPELFFPLVENGVVGHIAAGPAVAVCQTCPVAVQCLEWAVSTRQEHGIWGGLTTDQRAPLIRRSRVRV